MTFHFEAEHSGNAWRVRLFPKFIRGPWYNLIMGCKLDGKKRNHESGAREMWKQHWPYFEARLKCKASCNYDVLDREGIRAVFGFPNPFARGKSGHPQFHLWKKSGKFAFLPPPLARTSFDTRTEWRLVLAKTLGWRRERVKSNVVTSIAVHLWTNQCSTAW